MILKRSWTKIQPNCVIKNLQKKVRYVGTKKHLQGFEYLFTGATIRKKVNNDGSLGDEYYQAELQDPRNNRSIIIVRLSEIEEIEEVSF